jgi:myo-inositol 2-dehydrogenase/D-chiro-inositol 1-dehydrogenase
MSNTVNMALIGCGGWGREHLARARGIPELSFRAYVDVVEDAAQRAHDDFGGRYYTTDVDRVLGDESIDAVLIATHHDSHTPLAIRAAQAGKHIFLEKPMAMTVEECLSIEEAVARAGVKLMVGFKFRFAPLVARVKQVVKHPLVTVGQSLQPPMDLEWALSRERGGGPVLSNGCHVFDLVYWLNESEPVRISAEGGALIHPEMGLVDNVIVAVQFANGSIGAIISGDSGDARYTSKFFFEVLDGQRTATLYDRCHRACFSGWELDSLAVEDLPPDSRADPEGVRGELKAFATCVLLDDEPPIGPRDGTRATAMVLKAFEAIRTGRAQELGTG